MKSDKNSKGARRKRRHNRACSAIWGHIHGIGILAPTDPVAIDQASIDLCLCSAAEGSESLQKRATNLHGLHTLEHAEEIGPGSRTHELVRIDD